MRKLAILILGLAIGGALAGCATGSGGGAPATPTPSESQPSEANSDVDVAAQQKAEAWLDGAVLPPGAVSSATAPATTPTFSSQYYSWWCSPMVELTAYWTIAGAGVAETVNWLSAHPTADLMVAVPVSIPEDADVDMASVGNVPSQDALEGIAYTVARTSDGVAIRAEIGAIPESAVCPTPPPGVGVGGPGQG